MTKLRSEDCATAKTLVFSGFSERMLPSAETAASSFCWSAMLAAMPKESASSAGAHGVVVLLTRDEVSAEVGDSSISRTSFVGSARAMEEYVR